MFNELHSIPTIKHWWWHLERPRVEPPSRVPIGWTVGERIPAQAMGKELMKIFAQWREPICFLFCRLYLHIFIYAASVSVFVWCLGDLDHKNNQKYIMPTVVKQRFCRYCSSHHFFVQLLPSSDLGILLHGFSWMVEIQDHLFHRIHSFSQEGYLMGNPILPTRLH